MKKFLCLVLTVVLTLGSTLTVEAKKTPNVYDKEAAEYLENLEDAFEDYMAHDEWGTSDIVKDFEVFSKYEGDFIYRFTVRFSMIDGNTVDLVQHIDMMDDVMTCTYYKYDGRRVTNKYIHQKYPLLESEE